MNYRILVVDDDQGMCEMIEAGIHSRGFEVTWETSAAAAFEALKEQHFDAVLTDLNMPGMTGLALCERVAANWPDLPVVILTAFGSMESAIEAIRAGAFDFVTKPVKMDLLAISLLRAVRYHELQEKVKTLSEAVLEVHQEGPLLGNSPPMRALYAQLARMADSESSVLIMGESGSGKELAARRIHAISRRRSGPFVAVNCAALPEPLFESELFGHARGAFTDAREERKGLFLQANAGTLLLDEVSELPLLLQAKILRALEERSVRRVGDDKETAFDVRFLATTNRDLECAVEEGRFRKDLFFRLNVINLELPPLRSRGMDILLLAQRFLAHFREISGKEVSGISQAVADKLLTYDWPGNVRELRNAIERAVNMTRYEEITVEDLPAKIRAYTPSQILLGGSDPAELVSMEEVEKRYVLHVLKATGGNRTRAARILGWGRKTLYRKLASYGIPE